MDLVVNGEARQFEASAEGTFTVEQLLEALGLGGRRVAVEVNPRIVKRATSADAHLADGDTVEIVHFVGGG